MWLMNVARCQVESFLYYVGRTVLTQKQDLGSRRDFLNLSSGFDSVESGQSNVQQY